MRQRVGLSRLAGGAGAAKVCRSPQRRMRQQLYQASRVEERARWSKGAIASGCCGGGGGGGGNRDVDSRKDSGSRVECLDRPTAYDDTARKKGGGGESDESENGPVGRHGQHPASGMTPQGY